MGNIERELATAAIYAARRSGKYRAAMVDHGQHGHEAVKTNNQPRGENNGKPEVKDDGTRDEEEAPGGGEWERERGCPRGCPGSGTPESAFCRPVAATCSN